MPFRKIKENKKWQGVICTHPEHKPPMYTFLPPGQYEYTCPGCNAAQIITVPEVRFDYRGPRISA